jgi:hypothetical protein
MLSSTGNRPGALAAIVLAGAGTISCQPAGVPGSTALQKSWMFGIERMRGDPEPQLPYTNQFIADLAAMPSVQVVYVGDERNRFAFSAWTGGKVLVSPWLHGEGNCMNITYTIFASGQQQSVFGQVVPSMFAGKEPDSACVDRAAAQFYRALVVQGL